MKGQYYEINCLNDAMTNMHSNPYSVYTMNSNQNNTKTPSMTQDVPWIRTSSKKEITFREKAKDYIILEMRIEGQECLIVKDTNGKVSTERFPLTEESIDSIAKKEDIRTGKWLIFRPRSEIDEIWNTITYETHQGNLGIESKVSTKFQEKQKHVICVYTADYFDSKEVKGIREKLRKLGIQEQLYYKPDIFTHLGIYAGTCSIRPWKYKR